MHIGVIGAGVVGLTTALEIQKELPNCKVTIVADKFYKDTTSYVAAGIFRPGTSFSGPNDVITKKWINDAYQYWDDLRLTSDASLAGITQLSGYIFSSTSPDIVRNPLFEDIVYMYRAATEQELRICQGNWKYGAFFTTVLTDCGLFLPWALDKFKMARGTVLVDTVDSFANLYGKYDVVINCSGFRAKTLCKDRQLVPIRGQVIKVKAPWIKTAFYADYDTYIIPGFEAVTLGGCRQYDSYSLDVSRHDSAAIKERCEDLVPSLRGAEVLREAVGLRPHRAIVRVEPEIIETAKGSLKVVHNYGHGGYGVTTSPGTAKYAVQILKDVLSSNSKL